MWHDLVTTAIGTEWFYIDQCMVSFPHKLRVYSQNGSHGPTMQAASSKAGHCYDSRFCPENICKHFRTNSFKLNTFHHKGGVVIAPRPHQTTSFRAQLWVQYWQLLYIGCFQWYLRWIWIRNYKSSTHKEDCQITFGSVYDVSVKFWFEESTF